MEKSIVLNGGSNIYGTVFTTNEKKISLLLSEKSEVVRVMNNQIEFYGGRTELHLDRIAYGDRLFIFFSSSLVGIILYQTNQEIGNNDWCIELESLYIKHKYATKALIPYAIRKLLESVSNENSIAKQILVDKVISKPLIIYLEDII